MNIYRHEMRMSLRSMLYWTTGMLVGLLFFMMMFAAVSEEASVINLIVSQFPSEVVRALGLSTLDLSTVLGYYGYVFMFILLVASVYALKIGISALSEEIRAKTADFLLSKPVSRNVIVTAKALSVITLLALQSAIYSLGAFIIVDIITGQPYDKTVFLLINLSIFLVGLFFAGLGLLLSVSIKKIKSVLPVALGIVFGFAILQMLNQSLADPVLAYLTPFAYFDIARIINARAYESAYVISDAVLIVSFTLLTYIIYRRKDIPSV
ncbi:MAG: ABC transporter permease subunit [Syntrophomonadaceae bacterium]|nr:ABC transporter permease subunit [Syntrophomonadaceae bacterium]